MRLSGVWLPIITPFKNGNIDYVSYKKMIDHYVNTGINGIIPLGTTGESPTISEYEFEKLLSQTVEYVGGRLPVIAGVGGNCTTEVIRKVKLAEKFGISGILSVCPYYNRPGQEGVYSHFKSIADETSLDITIYNIPYRTGTNIENDTIRKLSEIRNITGLKDSCGDIKQTMALLMDPPKDFSIMTGEDILFFTTLTLGGHGGILASSHIKTELFVNVYNKVTANDTKEALAIWKELYPFIPLLFKESNPAPIKYCLNRLGLIDSPEVRLPLVEISDSLKVQLEKYITSKDELRLYKPGA